MSRQNPEIYAFSADTMHAALTAACAIGDATTTSALLRSGAPVRPSKGNSGKHTDGPLHAAARAGSVECIEKLLLARAYINAVGTEGVRPLHLAIEHGHMAAVQCLLRHGADPRAPDGRGYAPLHWLACTGNTLMILPLIIAGADIDEPADAFGHPNHGWSPIMIACLVGHAAFANTLAGMGASPRFRAPDGATSIHAAVIAGNVECLRHMLENGGDAHAPSALGTPLQIAQSRGYTSLANSLTTFDGIGLAHGAVEPRNVPNLPASMVNCHTVLNNCSDATYSLPRSPTLPAFGAPPAYA